MGTGYRPTTRAWPGVGEMTPRRGPAALPGHRPQATTTAAGSAPGHRVPCRQDFQQAGPDSAHTGPDALGCDASEGVCSRLRGQVPAVRRPVRCPGAAPPIRMAIALTEPAGGKMSKVSQYLFALPAPRCGARGTSQRRAPAPTTDLPPRPCNFSSPPTSAQPSRFPIPVRFRQDNPGIQHCPASFPTARPALALHHKANSLRYHLVTRGADRQRPGAVSGSQRRGTGHRLAEAGPPRRHALREAYGRPPRVRPVRLGPHWLPNSLTCVHRL